MKALKTIILGALLLSGTCAFADNFTIEEFTIKANGTTEIELLLHNTPEVYGFGLTINLPEGVSLATNPNNGRQLVKLTDRTEDGLVVAKYFEDRNLINIQYATGYKIYGNSGEAVLKITLQANDQIATGTHTLLITNQKITINNERGQAYVINCDETETPYTCNLAIDTKIAASGYTAFSWPRALDFSSCADVEAVYAGTDNGKTVHLEEIASKQVPAGTGVVIKGTASTVVNPQTIDDEPASVVSDLTPTHEAPFTVSGTNYYGLATKNGTTGFYRVKDGVTVPQYKLYLVRSANSANEFIGFDDDSQTTGLDTIEAQESEPTDVFTLAGQKVQRPTQKGVYVKNGRKVVVK